MRGVYKLTVEEQIAWPDGSPTSNERQLTVVAHDLPEALHLIKMARLGPTGDGSSVTGLGFVRAEYLGRVDYAA